MPSGNFVNIGCNIEITENGKKRPQYAIDSDFGGTVTLAELLEFTRASLILTADAVLREEQDAGFDKDPIVVVDGSTSKAVKNVSPLGTIEFTARADMRKVLLDTYAGILQRSPVLEGVYKASNYVFWNRTQVATDQASLDSWLNTDPDFDDKDLITFVNVQPYARKLERLGVTGQRQKSRTILRNRKKGEAGGRVAAPNGAYFLTARAIRAKYKRNSKILFTFLTGATLGIAGNFKTLKRGKPGRTYLYPCILISVQETGVV